MKRSGASAGKRSGVIHQTVAANSHCRVESLEGRVFLAADLGAKLEAVSKVDRKLLELVDQVNSGRNAVQAASDNRLIVDAQNRVSVTVRADNVNRVSAALTAAVGFRPTASQPRLHFVEGTIPINKLRSVAKLVKNVGRFGIRANYAPYKLTGSVNSQADFVQETDRVRATLPAGINGTGQRIGVISDSYNSLGGAPAGVASGDLPAAGVTVLQDSSGTDEGRGMAELIHDLAPGASIAFATANGGEANFANNIRRLANPADGNAKVIVDDVGYLAEPMFQDGVIAQAIDEVVTTRGVNYFTSAGNQSTQAYESTTFQTASDTIGSVSGTFYDFNTGAGVDTRQQITIAPGSHSFVLQWDDPFYTTNGVDTDLDFLVLFNGALIGGSADDNLFFQDPYEIFTVNNPNQVPVNIELAIQKFAGPNSGRIKYVHYGTSITFSDPNVTTGINAPTVVPHAAATNGQGVAAAPYFSQDRPESFTSKGPSTILFSPTGVPIAAQVRNTPQITGIDGTNTTFFGGSDTEGDGRKNFFGTSAAAPHVAAIAALVRQANPGFTPAQVYTRLQQTADDIHTAGFDTLTGHGLVNAFDAVYPTIVPAGISFTDGLESGVLSSAYETRATGAGRIQVTGANGPYAGARHLTMDASLTIADPVTGFGTQFSLNEVTLHVNATGPGDKILTFRQREYNDEDHPMPSSFTGSSNSDGVALSVDGVTWHRIISLTGFDSTNSFNLNTFNLTEFADSLGLALSADTRIRFQQYDDFSIPSGGSSDGFAFDEIAVTTSDLTAPTVSGWQFLRETRPLRLVVTFSEDVSTTLEASDLTVTNQSPGGGTYAAWAVSYDSGSNTATFSLPTPLPNGNYIASLPSDEGSVYDLAGNPLEASSTTFFILNGDVNGDRVVNHTDLGILSSNWNTTGKIFSDGDLNLDSTVDGADLLILTTNWFQAVPEQAEPVLGSDLAQDTVTTPVTPTASPAPEPAAPKARTRQPAPLRREQTASVQLNRLVDLIEVETPLI